ncbi:hypothetical protein Hanom_Chr05g00394721 [Helianthus anomalus]
MSFLFMRFGQFCDFRLKICLSTSGSKRFEILLFSPSSLTPPIFSTTSVVFFSVKSILNTCTLCKMLVHKAKD